MSNNTDNKDNKHNIFEYLFEKFNKFYENLFYKYGLFLSKYYIYAIIISFLFNAVLTCGFLRLKILDDVDEIYGVINSTGKNQERYLKKLFNTTDTFENKYYLHQLIDFGTWVEINFRVREDKNANILKMQYFNEILKIHELIINGVKYKNESTNQTFMFKDICAKLHERCMIDSYDVLTKNFFKWIEDKSYKKFEKLQSMRKKLAQKYPGNSSILENFQIADEEHFISENFNFITLKYFLGRHFHIIPYNRSQVYAKRDSSIEFAYAKMFKLRYSLASNHDDGDPNVKYWELELLKFMQTITSNLTTFTYGVSHSLDVEMDRNIRLDLKFVAFTFLLIMTFSIVLMSFGTNIITSPGFILPFSGVLSAVFGLTSAVGFLSIIGYASCGFIVAVPFLVLGVGINDMFIIYSAFMHTNENAKTSERISEALRKCGVSVTITSITDFVAFLIGLTADFRSVQIFCVYAAVAILFCYIYQMTFFSGWLVAHSERIKANRNCLLWCLKQKNPLTVKQQLNGDNKQHLNHEISIEDNNLKEKKTCVNNCIISRAYKYLFNKWIKFYRFLICNKYGKCIIGILFVAYFSCSVWGAINIREGIDPTDLVADDSHFKVYIESNSETVDLTPVVMFVFDKSLNYSDENTVRKINDILYQAQQLNGIRRDFKLNWLDHFKPTLDKLREGYNETYFDEFTNDNTPFSNDIVIKYNETLKQKQIIASRVFVQYEYLRFTAEDVKLMVKLRNLAESIDLKPIAYSNYFKHIERMEFTTPNVIQSFVIGIEIMYLVAIIFLPDIRSIICIVLSMISIIIGLIACMHAWGLTLSPITMALLILSVGFCIDFSAHLVHAFISSVGKGSRSRRAYYASMRIGLPIFNSAVSTILGIFVLHFSKSYFFTSFFKTILILMVLGILHSMFFLPVLLSIIGPHWKRHKQEPQQAQTIQKHQEASNGETKQLIQNGDGAVIELKNVISIDEEKDLN